MPSIPNMAGLQKRKIEEIIKIIAKKAFTKYQRGCGRLNNAPLIRHPCLNPYNMRIYLI